MKKLFEDFIESPDYIISIFFKELEAQVNNWFKEGSFAASGCEIIQFNTLSINPMQKTLMVDFVSPEFYFKMIFMIKVDEITDNEVDTVYLIIKRYTSYEEKMLDRELLDELKVDDVKEDYIIDKISELDDKEEGESNLDDNNYNIYD